MNISESTSPLYNIGVVSRITNIPVASLHAWERRYGYPVAARSKGGHRLYSEIDISSLRWIKAQVDSGLAVSQAVALLRNLEVDGRLSFNPEEGVTTTIQKTHAVINSAGREGAFPKECDKLMVALISHDLPRADQIMGEMLAFISPEDLTMHVIGPVLKNIGEAWEYGNIDVATEHLATNYLRHRLMMWMVTGPTPKPSNPIVLACAPGEWHEGSLLMLGVLLRRQGWPVTYLGQNVPFRDLARFMNNMHSRAVVLVAICAEAAQALVAWPKWIQQVDGDPLITFGGRAFIIQPELQGIVPGIYLGDNLPDGLKKLISLIDKRKE